MKKLILGIIFICLLSISVCLIAIKHETLKSNENFSVEKFINDESKKAQNVFKDNESLKLHIDKEKDRFICYPEGQKDSKFTMLIPSNFYEKVEFETPSFSKVGSLPKKQIKKMNRAKTVALEYVENSEIIKEKDKGNCKKSLKNVKIFYGNFLDKNYQNIGMVTVKNKIFVNSKLVNYFDEYTYLHEFIHVISNVTNKSTEYELSSYRSSKLNEVLTDLIAVFLAQNNNLKGYDLPAYEDYFTYSSCLISKLDLLNKYFYSDGYSKIKSDFFDLYVLLLDNLYDENCLNVIPYVINEIIK